MIRENSTITKNFVRENGLFFKIHASANKY